MGRVEALLGVTPSIEALLSGASIAETALAVTALLAERAPADADRILSDLAPDVPLDA